MKDRKLLNGFLFCLVLGLGWVAYFEPGKKVEIPNPLLKIDSASINTIRLQNAETIVFEKKDGVWREVEPLKAPVNQIRVNQLLEIAESKSEASYPIRDDELAQFDLDKPRVRLMLGTEELSFGGVESINQRRYVRVGDRLHLVADQFFHHLNASATDFVDKRLVTEGSKIQSIEVPGFKANLGSDGQWSGVPEAKDKQDYAEWSMLWSTARAIDVKRLEGIPAGDKIRLGFQGRDPLEFTVLSREPSLVLARPDLGLKFELTQETAKTLLMPPSKREELPVSEGHDEEHSESPELPPEVTEQFQHFEDPHAHEEDGAPHDEETE